MLVASRTMRLDPQVYNRMINIVVPYTDPQLDMIKEIDTPTEENPPQESEIACKDPIIVGMIGTVHH